MINRLLATAAVLAVAAVALAQVVPYEDPPFRHQCVVHHYEEHEAPPLDVPDDPLCVEFEKRDITASNGGAVRFRRRAARASPSRSRSVATGSRTTGASRSSPGRAR